MKYLILALLVLPSGASAWTSSYNFDVITNSVCQDPCYSDNVIQFEINTDDDVVSIAISDALFPILFNGVEYTSGNPDQDSFSNPTYWNLPMTIEGAGYNRTLNILIGVDDFTFTFLSPFNSSASVQLILDQLLILGLALLYILGSVILISIAMIVYNFGKRVLFDQSLTIGGYYVRQLPYKGYNRFRSKKWNSKNTT